MTKGFCFDRGDTPAINLRLLFAGDLRDVSPLQQPGSGGDVQQGAGLCAHPLPCAEGHHLSRNQVRARHSRCFVPVVWLVLTPNRYFLLLLFVVPSSFGLGKK